MPRAQLPAVIPKRKVRNKGCLIGQKRQLLPKQVWAVRAPSNTGNTWAVILGH